MNALVRHKRLQQQQVAAHADRSCARFLSPSPPQSERSLKSTDAACLDARGYSVKLAVGKPGLATS
jgi:hypothetical protein